MGTVGPGSIHLLNGLYDAKKSRTPVLALCGQVPLAEVGSDFFQEVDNDALFSDVAVFCQTVTSPEQMPWLLERAIQGALEHRGVAVLTLPGDVGAMDVVKDAPAAHFVTTPPPGPADPEAVRRAAELLDGAGAVTLLVGMGAREARADVLALADRLAAPMVLTLKAKEGLEHDNAFQVGQTGLIGNPAARRALDDADAVLMLGTDFPYRDWYPKGKAVVQVDARAEHIGRRTSVEVGVVGDAGAVARDLLGLVAAREDRSHLDQARERYDDWHARQRRLVGATTGEPRQGLLERARGVFENPDHRIRPEALAAAVDAIAADDAIFTSDTGMSTVWLSRFVELRGDPAAAGLLQPRLDGQRDAPGARRAGAGPLAPGRRVLRRRRPDDAARRPHHRGQPRPAGALRRLRQRPPGDGQARAGAGRPARVRHRAEEPRPRRRRPRDRACTASASRPPTSSRPASARRSPRPARRCSTS